MRSTKIDILEWKDLCLRLFGCTLVIVLTSCGLTPTATPAASATPLPTSTLTATAMPTSTNTATPTPTPTNTATPTPAPKLGSWHISDDHVAWDMNLPCTQDLSAGGFILGVDPATCEPGARGGSAVTPLTVPPAEGRQVIVLRLICPGPTGCAGSVTSHEGEGEVAIAVDGQTLWTAQCSSAGGCDPMALAQSPIIAFVTDAPAEHQIRLVASPHTVLPVAGFKVEWQPMPSSIQGIAYSPFRDCQNPHWGPYATQDEIRDDLLFVRHMGNAIRTYSSIEGQEKIPELARHLGLRVSAGAWLGSDKKSNEEEVTALIQLAQTIDLESVIVGNEVLLRGDLSEDELISYIQWVKSAVDVPVTTAEIGGILLQHPRVMDAVDYHLIHLYAYWDGIPIENAARYVVDQYHHFQKQAHGKRVVIGETGWPAAGPAHGSALPSLENQRRFLREFLTLAQREDVEFYYFAAFDELWKTEGGVGPYWGMMYSDRRNKYDLQSVLIPLDDVPRPIPDLAPLSTATPGPIKAEGNIFPVYTTYAAGDNHFAPSGWMGDIHAIHFTDCAQLGETWEDRVIEIQYTPRANDKKGWAGIYWLEPENNWGIHPGGYDLQDFAQLRFRARSTVEKAKVKFLVGGVYTGTYPSSIPKPIYAQEANAKGFVTLSTEWKEFHIDLRGADLSHVIDGFGWVAERARTPDGVRLYLDEIVFDQQPPPLLKPLPRPTKSPSPPPAPPSPADLAIYAGPTLEQGYDMGVDTSGHKYDWVTDMGGYMRMAYPPGQGWGAVYITVGKPAPRGQRQSRDFSKYHALAVDLRGEQGGEVVYIGVKDSRDLDDGRETKIPVTLTGDWKTYTFPLSDFTTADLTSLYIPIEFIFESGVGPETVYFRNVRYLAEH